VASPQDAWRSFNAAVRQWPDDAVALIGRGTASYRHGELIKATADYRAALALDASQVAARNNLAVVLLESGCVEQAREQILRIDTARLDGRMQAEITDTLRQIDARAGATPTACRIPSGE